MAIFQATNRVKATFKHDAFWYMVCEVLFWLTLGALIVTAYPAILHPTLILIEATFALSLVNALTGYASCKYRERRSARGIGEEGVNGVLMLLYGLYTLSSFALAFTVTCMFILMILVPI